MEIFFYDWIRASETTLVVAEQLQRQHLVDLGIFLKTSKDAMHAHFRILISSIATL
jgi:hypothetical protein